eukprot:TRINITY_DN10377_c0_g1_i1.p1 TRINITY_DN10377_c0_g1~~TRINITY_DN10377_c0_g1_i1.p1  ORF type:complete len:364 (+),score=87.64 TRINITY_DN10377_c0_g1_i1:23-1093(+)
MFDRLPPIVRTILPRLLSVRVAVLVLLCVQNSSHVLLIRASRGERGERYITSTNVLITEIVKMLVCVFVIAKDHKDKEGLFNHLQSLIATSAKVFVPAFLYFLQNILGFIALQNLQAGVYAVLSQLKIMTTALFSVTMLGKRLAGFQWRALCLLLLAVVIIQRPPESALAQEKENSASGLFAVIAITTLSGFASVYFEKVLKSSAQVTVWERNFQLSVYSIFFALVGIVWDIREIADKGFFYSYSIFSVSIVFTGACGGLLVALVMKYADNIIKIFSISISIVLTSILSHYFFGANLDMIFWVGVSMVILSVFNYNETIPAPPKPVLPAPETPIQQIIEDKKDMPIPTPVQITIMK